MRTWSCQVWCIFLRNFNKMTLNERGLFGNLSASQKKFTQRFLFVNTEGLRSCWGRFSQAQTERQEENHYQTGFCIIYLRWRQASFKPMSDYSFLVRMSAFSLRWHSPYPSLSHSSLTSCMSTHQHSALSDVMEELMCSWAASFFLLHFAELQKDRQYVGLNPHHSPLSVRR